MSTIKKNIWALFYIILFFYISFFSIVSYMKWKEINHEHIVQNENLAMLIGKSTQSYFKQIDMVLELLGSQLLENDNYKDTTKAKKLFSKMLSLNESIIAYALIDTKGNYLVTHLDEPVENIPGVFTREAAKESFLLTLKTNKVVIGRTYKLIRTKRLAIPVRKTFFDKKGKPLSVMSLAIDVKNTHLFDEELLSSKSGIIHLFRDSDKYRQLYIDKSKKDLDKIYFTPLPLSQYNNIINNLEKSYNKSIMQIKSLNKAVSFIVENFVDSKKYIVSTKYIKDYDLWANSYLEYEKITRSFFIVLLKYFIAFITVVVITWYLFRYIDCIEKKKRKDLEYKATHDTLTNLPNRYYLFKNIDTWRKNINSFSVLFIDLDNFKYINDTHGHKVGDEVLKKVAQILRNTLDKKDLLIRQGGDEFIVFIANQHSLEDDCKVLISSIQSKIKIDNIYFTLDVSIGAARFPNDSKDIEELISNADIALYEAKKNKSKFVIFTKEVKDRLLENIEIEKELKSAFENNEFSLVFQPQINSDASLHGVETLIRWNNKKLGFVRPDKFIPIAEAIGLMPKLGDFIINSALSQIVVLQKETSIKLQVAINISVKQFIEKDFFEKIVSTVKEYDIAPSSVTLEVTETIFIKDLTYMINLLFRLKKEGFIISMDDFGTGYSSLSMLRKIPIDELKIDKEFVDDIVTDKSAKHMIETIVSIGKILKYNMVLAEGLETKEQLELLNELGCDTYQGYYYSKPLKLNELREFVRNY